MKSQDASEAAAVLRRLVDAVRRGDLTAPAHLLHRVEGAAQALAVAAKRRAPKS